MARRPRDDDDGGPPPPPYPGNPGTQGPVDPFDGMQPVLLPSGAPFFVHPVEKEFWAEKVRSYTEHFQWRNASDLGTLDGILGNELLIWRFQVWSSIGRDYNSVPINEDRLSKTISDLMNQTRQLKKMLGMDKPSREKESSADNVAAYLDNLMKRAEEFGIHRNEQAALAIELLKEVLGVVTRWRNSVPEERERFGCRSEDIVPWLDGDIRARFDALDTRFREEQQRFWIGDL